FCPCCRKSRKSAQITSSLSLLREPRSRPAGLPDCPGCQRGEGMVMLSWCLSLDNYMKWLAIRNQAERRCEFPFSLLCLAHLHLKKLRLWAHRRENPPDHSGQGSCLQPHKRHCRPSPAPS